MWNLFGPTRQSLSLLSQNQLSNQRLWQSLAVIFSILVLYSTKTRASIPNPRHVIRVLQYNVQCHCSISQSFRQRFPSQHRQRLWQGSSGSRYIFVDIFHFFDRWSCRLWNRVISFLVNQRQIFTDIVSHMLDLSAADFLMILWVACHVRTSYQRESGQQRLRKVCGNGSILYSIPRTRNLYRSVVWMLTSSFGTCEPLSRFSFHLHSSFSQSCFP